MPPPFSTSRPLLLSPPFRRPHDLREPTRCRRKRIPAVPTDLRPKTWSLLRLHHGTSPPPPPRSSSNPPRPSGRRRHQCTQIRLRTLLISPFASSRFAGLTPTVHPVASKHPFHLPLQEAIPHPFSLLAPSTSPSSSSSLSLTLAFRRCSFVLSLLRPRLLQSSHSLPLVTIHVVQIQTSIPLVEQQRARSDSAVQSCADARGHC
jgi:hypothetical protein